MAKKPKAPETGKKASTSKSLAKADLTSGKPAAPIAATPLASEVKTQITPPTEKTSPAEPVAAQPMTGSAASTKPAKTGPSPAESTATPVQPPAPAAEPAPAIKLGPSVASPTVQDRKSGEPVPKPESVAVVPPKPAASSSGPTPPPKKLETTVSAVAPMPEPLLEEPVAKPSPAAGSPSPQPSDAAPPKAPQPVLAEEPEPPHAPHEWSPPEPYAPWRPSLFIVHITPELAPVAKVGGLADVVFGLSREMEIRGNNVEIILPKYDCMRYDHIWGLQLTYDDLWVPWFGEAIHCSVYFGFVHGRKCFFIEPHSQDNFFDRGAVYGFNDDVLRFAFFSRAAMEFLWKSGKSPDIIHCHDWQTALVPVYLYEIYQPLGMNHPRACFTIHNFKHQGVTGAQVLNASGLNRPEYFSHYDRLRDNHNPHAINLMKGGIVYSNFVTTVSPRYAMEAKDQGQGFGLEPTLHIHHAKYGGVVNGIDYDVWNPEIDPLIPVHYTVDAIEDKYANKKALRDRLLIADSDKPIVAFVGRLDPQKGLELIRHALFYTLAQGGQFVLLGSSPDGSINGYFWGLKHQFNDHPDVHLEIGYNEELAHLIYAGADIMLVPSRFEPCGLTQLIAMRYGTIPVVREIGGLADTVFDKDYSQRPLHERNGYLFRDYDEAGLESALDRAIACYYQYPDHFRELMKNAMRYDYSWNHPGQDYLNIYDYIRAK